MATDMFLKIADIQGESKDSKHKDEIEVLSFSYGVAQQGGQSYGGGGGVGKASFNDAQISKRVDKGSHNLMLACATGKHIPEAVIVCRKAGGEQHEYLTVTLKNCIISSIQTSGHDGGVVLESVTINFTEMKFQYKEQQADGSIGASMEAGYNVKEQRKV